MEDFFFLTVINFLMSVIGSDLGLILVSKRVLNSNLENFQQKKKKEDWISYSLLLKDVQG